MVLGMVPGWLVAILGLHSCHRRKHKNPAQHNQCVLEDFDQNNFVTCNVTDWKFVTHLDKVWNRPCKCASVCGTSNSLSLFHWLFLHVPLFKRPPTPANPILCSTPVFVCSKLPFCALWIYLLQGPNRTQRSHYTSHLSGRPHGDVTRLNVSGKTGTFVWLGLWYQYNRFIQFKVWRRHQH